MRSAHQKSQAHPHHLSFCKAGPVRFGTPGVAVRMDRGIEKNTAIANDEETWYGYHTGFLPPEAFF